MKKLFCLFTLLTCFLNAHAQGTLEFRVNLDGAGMTPPTSSIAIGYGTFYLEPNNRFHGLLGIQNPALPAAVQLNSIGQNGSLSPVLLTLTPGGEEAPDGSIGFPGAQSFDGTINLTSEQRADLLAGRMYFTATTAAFPEGELRGQLLLV
ncbi:MAG: CHRD domain-containing protein, partial [Verrucomicrobiota bacterium]|nr:CHRD domain-containing protein [Verrucomicrobiota bacterium]